MRIFSIALLVILSGQGVVADSVSLKETPSGVTVTVTFDEETLDKVAQGERPEGFLPLGQPGDPALYAKPIHIAIPADAVPGLSISRLETREEAITLPRFTMEDLRPLDHDSFFPVVDSADYDEEILKRFSAFLGVRDSMVTISAPKTFRQVTYVDLLIRPALPVAGRGDVKILTSASLYIDFPSPALESVRETAPFERLYDRFFANEWRDKGSHRGATRQVTPWQPPAHSGDVYKIIVDKDGLYSLDYSFLDTNTTWVLSSIDPVNFRLFNMGEEIPLYVKGESDHSFNITDLIYFYGEALTGESDAGVWCAGDFTDENIYWLLVGTETGSRMTERAVNPQNIYPTPSYFESTVHFEENPVLASFQTQIDIDLWLWKRAFWFATDPSQGVQTHAVVLPYVAFQPTYQATIDFHARGTSYCESNPDHHFTVGINGTPLGSAYAEAYDPVDLTLVFSQSLFALTGTITVDVTHEVSDPAILGCTSDSVYSDWFKITYARSFEAYSDELKIPYGEGNHQFTITQFKDYEILALDISDPANPIRLTNPQIMPDSGNYKLTFQDTIPAGGYTYFTANPLIVLADDFVLDTPSQLQSTDPPPHWVLITPDAWKNSTGVQNLESLRQSQGLTTLVASITDVYDEFSYGIFSPHAIRYFLEHLYTLTSPPALQYAVLLGDADYDYKDHMQNGNNNFVPTYMVADPGLASSAFHPYSMHSFDNYFGCFSGSDSIPEIFVGRLPARDITEADETLGKIYYYETGIIDTSWLGKTLFSTDCGDAELFEPGQEINSSYVNPIPPHSTYKMYFRLPPWNCDNKDVYQYIGGVLDMTPNGIADLADEFNEGYAVVSWNGHGGFQQWGTKNYLNVSDFPDLTNSAMPTVTLNANCYTGAYYHSIVQPSFLEGLMTGSNGMVAGISPGTYMFSFQDGFVLEPFYREAFSPEKERLLGSLFLHSVLEIAATGDERLTQGLVILGDPATRLAIPTPDPPKNLYISDTDCRMVELTWDPPGAGFDGTYNIYRSEDGGATYLLAGPSLTTTYQDTDIVYGITYDYHVAGIDQDGFEGSTTSVVTHYAAPCEPANPTNLTCTNPMLGRRLDFNWNSIGEPEIDTYRLYYGTIPMTYTDYVDTGDVTDWRIEGLEEGTTYYVAISSFNTFGLESIKSTEVSCSSSHELGWAPPKMVYPLTLTKDPANRPLLAWDLPNQDIWGSPMLQAEIDTCSVYRSENPDFVPDRSTSSPDRIASVDATFCMGGTCTHTDTAAPNNAFYYITCETPTGEESAVGHAPPAHPGHFNVTKGLGVRWKLTWDPITTRMDAQPAVITLYDIYRSLTPGLFPDVKDKNNWLDATAETFYTDLPPDAQTYYYKVMGVDEKGNSGPF